MSSDGENERTSVVNGDKPCVNELEKASGQTSLGLDKNELIRLIVQAVDGLGYSNAARVLETESGTTALTPTMRRLRECVLSGNWAEVDSVFDSASNSFASESDQRSARFVVYEQQFLELLEAGNGPDALQCLRGRLARCATDASALHKLPLLCMCSSPEEVRKRANWPGAGIESRTAVLRRLQKYIPPSFLLAEDRLQILLQQAIQGQKERTMYPYTRQREVSLLEDLEHSPARVPRKAMFRLEGHTDEVWFIQFSRNGKYLASASKDHSVIIWDWGSLSNGSVDVNGALKCRLKGHSKFICLVSWAPDDSHVLSCGKDKSVRLWSVSSGECTHVFLHHTDQVTCCCWMPDGQTFYSGGLDGQLCEWDAWSHPTSPRSSFAAGARVNDMTVTADGQRLVVICTDNHIRIFDTQSKSELSRMVETVSITSLSLSRDGRYLLVNTSANDVERPEIHIWDLDEERMCKKFKGFKQQRYVIRACFGGYDQMLVLCGSEDNLVYMWQRHDGNVLAQLEGHTATVNSVAWCPTDPNVFASGSDDNKVIIWGVGGNENNL